MFSIRKAFIKRHLINKNLSKVFLKTDNNFDYHLIRSLNQNQRKNQFNECIECLNSRKLLKTKGNYD